MTEEKLVERVTALFADSDAAQRKMIRLYAETNDAIEASAIIVKCLNDAAPFVQIALKSAKKLAVTYRLAQTNFGQLQNY